MNVLLLCGFLVVFWLHSLVYGPFETAESEELYAKFLAATLEFTLLAYFFDIDIDIEFILSFIWLLVGSTWVWIGNWRIESLSQQPCTQLRVYERILIGILTSLIFEMLTITYLICALKRGSSVELITMLAFEHAVLTISAMTTTFSFVILLAKATNSSRGVEPRASDRA